MFPFPGGACWCFAHGSDHSHYACISIGARPALNTNDAHLWAASRRWRTFIHLSDSCSPRCVAVIDCRFKRAGGKHAAVGINSHAQSATYMLRVIIKSIKPVKTIARLKPDKPIAPSTAGALKHVSTKCSSLSSKEPEEAARRHKPPFVIHAAQQVQLREMSGGGADAWLPVLSSAVNKSMERKRFDL